MSDNKARKAFNAEPAILLVARRKSGKTQTRMRWTNHVHMHRIRDDVMDENPVKETGAETEATDEIYEYRVELGDRHVRVIDVPGEIVDNLSEQAGRFQENLLRVAGNISGILLCVAPPAAARTISEPQAGFVLPDKWDDYYRLFSAGDHAASVPDVRQALARIDSAMAFCEQFLPPMRIRPKNLPFAVQMGFADFVSFGDSLHEHRQRVRDLRAQYKSLWPDAIEDWLDPDQIEQRLKCQPNVDAMVSRAFGNVAGAVRHEHAGYRFWFFAASNFDELLGHRSAAMGFSYLVDQIVGKEILEQANEVKRAQDEANHEREREERDQEQARWKKERAAASQRLRQVLGGVALLTLTALAVAGLYARDVYVNSPGRLPPALGLRSCRDPSIPLEGRPDRCACAAILVANGDPKAPIRDRVLQLEPYTVNCWMDRRSATPALLQAEAALPLVSPDAFHPSHVARAGIVVGTGTGPPLAPFYPAVTPGEVAFVRWVLSASASRGDPPSPASAYQAFTPNELSRLPRIGQQLSTAIAVEGCLKAWRLARQHEEWEGVRDVCTREVRKGLPRSIQARLEADAPLGGGTSVLAGHADEGQADDDFESLLFPVPQPDDREIANRAAAATTPEEFRSLMALAPHEDPAHLRWLELLAPGGQEERVRRGQALSVDELGAMLAFLGHRWLAVGRALRGSKERRVPHLPLTRAVDAGCALAGAPWREGDNPSQQSRALWPVPVTVDPLDPGDIALIRARLAWETLKLDRHGADLDWCGCAVSALLTLLRSTDWVQRLHAARELDGPLRTVESYPLPGPIARDVRCQVMADLDVAIDPPPPSWLVEKLEPTLRSLAAKDAPRAVECALRAVLYRAGRHKTDEALAVIETARGFLDSADIAALVALLDLLDPSAVRNPEATAAVVASLDKQFAAVPLAGALLAAKKALE